MTRTSRLSVSSPCPKVTTTEVASAVMAPLARNLEALTSSKSS
jgi:hypothetical protein